MRDIKEVGFLKKRLSKKNDDFKIIRKSNNSENYIMKLTNVNKFYGDLQVLKNINLMFSKKERVGIVGANGAGKTTLVEIMAGIVKPNTGQMEIGYPFKNSFKEGIGMQFQQSTYPSGLIVKDIISFAINLRKIVMSNSEIKEILRIFQMDDLYRRKVRFLSGGQKQKLNILLSVLHKPKLVILDELSTGLDISAREDIINFTSKLLVKNEMTAIIISHHMAEIKSLCSKVIVLKNGAIDIISTIDELEAQHGPLENYVKKIIVDSQSQISSKKSQINSNSKAKLSVLSKWKSLLLKKDDKQLDKKDNH